MTSLHHFTLQARKHCASPPSTLAVHFLSGNLSEKNLNGFLKIAAAIVRYTQLFPFTHISTENQVFASFIKASG